MNRHRILLVDDEPSFTRLLKINLEQIGPYEVRVVNAPENVLHTARQFAPELILLDLVMPHLDGTEVAAQLQADPQLRRVPLLFLTAAPPRNSTSKLPPFPVLAKPASIEAVVAGIEAILSPTTADPREKVPLPDPSPANPPREIRFPWHIFQFIHATNHDHEHPQETHPNHR
jgi:CheY-like chemotaxis protein